LKDEIDLQKCLIVKTNVYFILLAIFDFLMAGKVLSIADK
jgi:hypothetical protein